MLLLNCLKGGEVFNHYYFSFVRRLRLSLTRLSRGLRPPMEVHMAKEFAKAFYDSPAWIRCRRAFIHTRIQLDGGLCQECHERPGVIVHHRVHLNPSNINDPAFTLSFSNLEYVCHQCHDQIHGNVSKLPKGMVRYSFGPDGNIIIEDTNASEGGDHRA